MERRKKPTNRVLLNLGVNLKSTDGAEAGGWGITSLSKVLCGSWRSEM
jgi:hypothetical protein